MDEIELKWSLTAEEHAVLRHQLRQVATENEVQQQENRFYDSPEADLRRAGMALRLRHENDRVILTCKSRPDKSLESEGLHHHREEEQLLDEVSWEDITTSDELPAAIHLPERIRQALSGRTPRLLASFSNRRVAFHRQGEDIALDQTRFSSERTDYELEIETQDPAHSRDDWNRFLSDWGIERRPQLETKFHRIMDMRGQGTP